MEPLTTSALITGGASLLGAGGQAVATGKMNRKTRAFVREQYERQKQDNLAYWHMQNDYNSPTSQMARLREAGLNPMLMNGSASGGQAPSLDAPSSQSWNPETPKFDLGQVAGDAVNTYFDVKMKNQQYDNLKSQNTVSLEQAKLLQAQTSKTQADTASTLFQFGMDSELRDTSLDYKKAMLKKLNNEVDSSLFDANLKFNDLEYSTKTLDSRQRMQFYNTLDAEQKTEFNKLDYDMRKEGIQSNDPIYMRVLWRQFGPMLEKFLPKNK